MNAALTEVTIDRTAIAIASPQPIEITQVRANPGGRNGRILPTFPGGRFARHEGCCAEARLANSPHHAHLIRLREDLRRRRRSSPHECGLKPPGLRFCVAGVLTAEFDEQPCIAIRLQRDLLRVFSFALE